MQDVARLAGPPRPSKAPHGPSHAVGRNEHEARRRSRPGASNRADLGMGNFSMLLLPMSSFLFSYDRPYFYTARHQGHHLDQTRFISNSICNEYLPFSYLIHSGIYPKTPFFPPPDAEGFPMRRSKSGLDWPKEMPNGKGKVYWLYPCSFCFE